MSEFSNVGKRLSGVLFLMSKSTFLVKLNGKTVLHTGQTNKKYQGTTNRSGLAWRNHDYIINKYICYSKYFVSNIWMCVCVCVCVTYINYT